MSRVMIDTPLAERLTAETGTVELVDSTGRVVGRFIPHVDIAEGELSAEETARRLAPGRKQYTTAEVLAHLRSLP